MKFNCSLEPIELGDDVFCVPVGSGATEVAGIIKTNKAGYEIIKLLEESKNDEKVVELLSNKYDNDRSDLAGYVHIVLQSLSNANIIEGK